ncbi:lytic polysaccharide monooxygenase [Zasmidium cellare ATCC 36951]|uniref:Lytic polysaccharide monooxygenase n=1 Tax=Zasmidium cellare ATCC 36951 TaxID=1080233 RepID=A0A6A6CBX0_ZASCE|nr:lytic polysaccharide monooxygenase [Zasmidium cellare ATCC 36951]KAF2164555.1 lytic polysaccharide monooxygenase [Zasmidium cellare ATCC 36951]
MFLACALVGALFAANSFAHMALNYPAPFNARNNPHRASDSFDPYLEFPYDKAGPNARWQYPCRGYQKLMGTPEGAPTATWEAGSTQNWNISGIGNHFGGSCQVGFSVDGGETFRVATSYEGNCPHRNNGNGPEGQDFEFKVPGDIEPGVHIFAWIWYNREQEFNMNCAAVNIEPAASSHYVVRSTQGHRRLVFRTKDNRDEDAGFVAFNDRPLMFVADDGNECLTPHTTAELKYPHPGPDVVQGDGAYPLELPSGKCAPSQMLLKQGYNGANGNDGHA